MKRVCEMVHTQVHGWLRALLCIGIGALLGLPLVGCQQRADARRVARTVQEAEGVDELWAQEDVMPQQIIEPSTEEFIALGDEDLRDKMRDGSVPLSMLQPGAGGVPGIEQFATPMGDLASIFLTLHFDTNDHTVRNKEELAVVSQMAKYLREHPYVYLFIEGHCDERGAEAYNLSLGTRRANYVRTLLVQRGVSVDQLFTISYGKEKPAVAGHAPDVWAQNRRAQFKVYRGVK